MVLPDPSLLPPLLAFDTETTGLTRADKAFGLSVAWEDSSRVHGAYWDIRDVPMCLHWLRDVAKRPGTTLVAHNTPFDYKMLGCAGLLLDENILDDTITRAVLIDEHLMSYSLDDLALKYLKTSKDSTIYLKLASIFGGLPTRNVQMRNISKAPADIVAPYAIQDAKLVLRLYNWQGREIKRQGIESIVEFERRVMPTLLRAEWRGIRVDLDAAQRARQSLTPSIDSLQRQLDELAGRPVNVNSSPQVRALFSPVRHGKTWMTDSGHVLELTGTGAPCIDALALRAMEGDKRADLILAIRNQIKTRDTFLAGHVIGSAVNGRVYPSINQTKREGVGTTTGRLSYSSPALQQLPSRGGPAIQMVKSAFLPEEGHKWVSFDMNSFEVRVFAHFVNDPSLNATYANNELADFHQAVADLTGLPRSAKFSGQANAKQLSLSLIFGSGNGSVAAKMGMPWTLESFTTNDGEEVSYKKAGKEAMEVINTYHEKVPGVKDFMGRAKKIVTSRGYLKTNMGRRIRMPDPRFAYKQHGLLIQATAADISKITWLVIEDVLKRVGGYILMSVHDSFEISVPQSVDEYALRGVIQSEVRKECSWFRIPLVIDLNGSGWNYYEAVKK